MTSCSKSSLSKQSIYAAKMALVVPECTTTSEIGRKFCIEMDAEIYSMANTEISMNLKMKNKKDR